MAEIHNNLDKITLMYTCIFVKNLKQFWKWVTLSCKIIFAWAVNSWITESNADVIIVSVKKSFILIHTSNWKSVLLLKVKSRSDKLAAGFQKIHFSHAADSMKNHLWFFAASFTRLNHDVSNPIFSLHRLKNGHSLHLFSENPCKALLPPEHLLTFSRRLTCLLSKLTAIVSHMDQHIMDG